MRNEHTEVMLRESRRVAQKFHISMNAYRDAPDEDEAMNRRCVIVVLLVLATSFYVGVSVLPENASAAVLYVGGGGPGNHTLIRYAIENASAGDTIFVYNGTYRENVIVNKTVSLVGEDRNTTIIDGAGSDALLMASDWVNVTGFSMVNASAESGVNVSASSRCRVSGNVMSNNLIGITATASPGLIISGNIVSNNSEKGVDIYVADGVYVSSNFVASNALYGIAITATSDGYVANNAIMGHGMGIEVYAGVRNTFYLNVVSNNSFGSVFWVSDWNVIYHNNFINNTSQASDNSLTNSWDGGYPTGGNFWSDHISPDLLHGPGQNLTGADGIVDIPRLVEKAMQDWYPLAKPYPPSPRAPPTAPLNLQGVPDNTQVTLTWSPPDWDGLSAVTNYAIYRGMAPGAETLLTTIGNVTTHLDAGLTNGLTYYYEVAAINAAGEGPRSNEANATPARVPNRPRQLNAVGGDSNIALDWLPPANNGGAAVTNYTIYRGLTSGGESLLVRIGNVLTYLDTGLTNGVTYYYTVTATNVMGEGPDSTEASATPTAWPSQPMNLNAASGDTQLVLTWNAPASDGGSPITNYEIYRGTTSGGETYLRQVGNVLTSTDTGLTNGQRYFYKIAARNAVGEGPQSGEASAIPGIPPGPPTGLTASGGNRQVLLTWSPPTNNGGIAITNYVIYRGLASGAESYLKTIGNVTTNVDTPLVNGVTNFYKVAAVNPAGEGAQSAEASATPMSMPSAPTGVVAMSTYFSVIVEWQAPLDTGGSPVTNYSVYRGTSPGGETWLATVGNLLQYTDISVANGQTYYYFVTAINAVGEGARSLEVRTTVPDHPSAPLNLMAASGTANVTLTWDPPASDGGCTITNYSIYRGFWSGGETLLMTVGIVTTYLDTDVTNGVAYFYRVTATNAIGEGPKSNEAMAVPSTLPSPPTIVSATGIDGEVVLTIFPPADSGGLPIITYKMYRGTSPGGEVFIADIGTPSKHFDAGLTNGVMYYYTLSAVNAIGESNLSEEASAMPRALPSQPLNPQATAGFGQVQLTWQAPAKDGGYPITAYKVYRGIVSGGETLLATLGDVLSYTDLAVTNGPRYFYKVSATTEVGEGPQSTEVSATPMIPSAAPSPPQNLVALAGNAQVALAWDTPASDGGSPVTGYSLYRGTAAGGEVFIRTVGDILSYTDTGLTNGQTYYYEITASNLAGESGRSNEVSARPAMVPGQPTGLVAVADTLQATLSWVAPANDGGSSITNYIIYRGATSGSETMLATVGNVLSYVDTNVVGGHAYYYRVSAVNAIGAGPQSVEASVTISPPPNLPPTCSITAPPQGADVSGRAAIQGVAADADGNIVVVEIRIDGGSWIGASGKDVWSYALNTKLYSNGQHTIEARSYDGKDFSQVASVTVSVNNPAEQGPSGGRGSSDAVGIALSIALLVVALLLIFLFLVERRSRKPAAKLPESPPEKEPPAEEFEEEWEEEEEPPEEFL